MEINDRILELISATGLSRSAFSQEVGIQPQTLHHIVSGRRTKPGCEVLEKIVLRYPELNPGWLLTGKGAMWLTYSETGAQAAEEPAVYGTRLARLEQRVSALEHKIGPARNNPGS